VCRGLDEEMSNSIKRLSILPTPDPLMLLCPVANKCPLWQTPARSEAIMENTPSLCYRSLEKGITQHHLNELPKATRDLQRANLTGHCCSNHSHEFWWSNNPLLCYTI